MPTSKNASQRGNERRDARRQILRRRADADAISPFRLHCARIASLFELRQHAIKCARRVQRT
jgi:hypothetical protein